MTYIDLCSTQNLLGSKSSLSNLFTISSGFSKLFQPAAAKIRSVFLVPRQGIRWALPERMKTSRIKNHHADPASSRSNEKHTNPRKK